MTLFGIFLIVVRLFSDFFCFPAFRHTEFGGHANILFWFVCVDDCAFFIPVSSLFAIESVAENFLSFFTYTVLLHLKLWLKLYVLRYCLVYVDRLSIEQPLILWNLPFTELIEVW